MTFKPLAVTPANMTPMAMTMGDPAGVGPLITWAAWRATRKAGSPFLAIADPRVLAAVGDASELAVIAKPGEAASVFPDRLPVLPIACGGAPVPGKPDVAAATAVIESIEQAVALVRAGQSSAVITNPVSKALLYQAGFPHPGHTEFLAALAANGGPVPMPVMMLCGGGLRVALATIHAPLSKAIELVTRDRIETVAGIVDRALKRDFGLAGPRIGLCGLNPHAGENGSLGREEIEIINPAAASLREQGLIISDARPGDTIFHEALSGRYDAVLAMYHDQGLIPVKTLDIWGGVNVTLGLPFIRTSPDHGTAYDAAAAGAARPDSLIAALKLAGEMVTSRAAFDACR
jgi:4-hydroxythreonine-4-phosphate dehydrogenase